MVKFHNVNEVRTQAKINLAFADNRTRSNSPGAFRKEAFKKSARLSWVEFSLSRFSTMFSLSYGQT